MGYAIVSIVIVVVLFWGWKRVTGGSGPKINAETLQERLSQNDDLCVLDVRSLGEYNAGHVPGATHICHQEVGVRTEELAAFRERDVVVYCEHGLRAAAAIRALHKAGFTQIYHLQGDMAAWRAAQRPMERDS